MNGDDEALDWLKGLPFTVAFVAGNRKNYDALGGKYPIENWHGGKVQPIRPHVLPHLMRGQVFGSWPAAPSSPWAGRPPTT